MTRPSEGSTMRCAFIPERTCHIDSSDVPLDVCRLCVYAWKTHMSSLTVKRPPLKVETPHSEHELPTFSHNPFENPLKQPCEQSEEHPMLEEWRRSIYSLFKISQILRPHSDRLMEVFKLWLETNRFLPCAEDPTDTSLKVTATAVDESTQDTIDVLPFFVQHLESGYPEIFSELTTLEKQIREHNDSVREFDASMRSLVEDELGSPDAESKGNGRRVYYPRIISLALSKVLTGRPQTEPEVIEKTPDFELSWNGSSIVIGDREYCERGLKLIGQLQASRNVAEIAKLLHEKAKKLNTEREKLRTTLYFEVVSKIKVGGIIQGKCNVCSSIL